MSHRVIEEEVRTTPVETTYATDDPTWAGRTIALILLVAVLIVGGIWLINNVSNNNTKTGPPVNVPGNQAPANPGDNNAPVDNGNNNNVNPPPQG